MSARTPDPLLPPAPDPWAVKVHAQATTAATGDVPEYGSPAFHALPETSPLRIAATVEAAEAWRTYWDPAEHARRLEVELAAARAMVTADERRLADAIGWAAGAPGRVEVLAAAATRAIREAAVRPPAEPLSAPRPLVQDRAWPPVVSPPGAVLVADVAQEALVRQVGEQLRTERAAPGPPSSRPALRVPRRGQSVGASR